MVKIRLRRMGTIKKPLYRIVVAEARAPRNGAFIETVGHFNPRTEPVSLVVDEERVLHWLRHGAQPTATVAKLLEKLSIKEKLQKVGQANAG